MAEPNEIQRLSARVNANFEILSAGLGALSREVREGATQSRETCKELQSSIARLAAQQDAHARRFNEIVTSTLEKSDAVQNQINDGFDVLARQYDSVGNGLSDLDAVKERLAAVEEDVRKLKESRDDAA